MTEESINQQHHVDSAATTTPEPLSAKNTNTVNEANSHSEAEAAPEAVTAEMRTVAANSTVKNHIIASMTLGLVPVPLFDLAALTATQMNMMNSLARYYGIDAEDNDTKSLLMSLAGGSLPVLSVLGLSSFAKLIPGIGTLAGSASVSVIAGAMTYAVGQVFIMHFEAGGTLEDFDPKQARTFFKREFEAGKTFVANLRDELKALKPGNQAEAETTEEAAPKAS